METVYNHDLAVSGPEDAHFVCEKHTSVLLSLIKR